MIHKSVAFGFFIAIEDMFCDSELHRMNVTGTNFTVQASAKESLLTSIDFWLESCSSLGLIVVLFAAFFIEEYDRSFWRHCTFFIITQRLQLLRQLSNVSFSFFV